MPLIGSGAKPMPTTGMGGGVLGGASGYADGSLGGVIGPMGAGAADGSVGSSYGQMQPWDGVGSEGSGGMTGKGYDPSEMTLEPDGMGNWSTNGGVMQSGSAAGSGVGSWLEGDAALHAPDDSGAQVASAPIEQATATNEQSVPPPDQGSMYDMGQLGMAG